MPALSPRPVFRTLRAHEPHPVVAMAKPEAAFQAWTECQGLREMVAPPGAQMEIPPNRQWAALPPVPLWRRQAKPWMGPE